MNYILKSYFDRLNSFSKNKLKYYVYERDAASDMPFSVHLQFESKSGSVHNSWGSGKSLDDATGKAMMELIERVTFSYVSPLYFKKLNGFLNFEEKSLFQLGSEYALDVRHLHPSNTNGVAIHLTMKEAKKRAFCELLERHTILYALLKNISPHGSKKKTIAGKMCEFFYWEGSSKTITVVGAIEIDKGTYFSSGTDFSLEKAMLKSELELNSFILLEESVVIEKDPIKRDWEIVRNDIDSFNRYHRFSGNKDALGFLRTKSGIKFPNLSDKDFYFCKLSSPQIFDGLLDLPCVRVIHPDVQQLFFDNWDYNYLNPRLFTVNDNLPSFPHIIA